MVTMAIFKICFFIVKTAVATLLPILDKLGYFKCQHLVTRAQSQVLFRFNLR